MSMIFFYLKKLAFQLNTIYFPLVVEIAFLEEYKQF